MNSQQPHLACLAAWHALESALVKAPGASLKWSLPRSPTACGCARLTPGSWRGDLAGGLAVAPARRRSWGSGLSIAVQHNHGRTCIRTSRSSLRGIAAEDLCRSTHSLVSVTACLTRRRGDRFDLEQKIRLDQFRHDEQHRRRSCIAQKFPSHLDVSRNIVGAQ